ncbi:LacI family DNA-binding transcriptional regulator [Verminephrobacter aporrectodeae]|uniref:LacI family DNA-binding transcriptional regulator n=1 Tax=Verminephrobacter aporrectodeae subsp. tuberculatae TaxID=1110392 RepID=A0ABT3KPA2_9BURK|nr:LacI family DNA-binding transcriptional regulator [Verminephrobacter aporrectodeae]MCW5255132.1 LacI family DNA-binding transcriptional regulator [Verminephrobacter aporrectodeae subsp. tuberculatae]MCW5320143.1 LacI family DNA-binding transcriptional regulator [Verminephrobacter aporrectodeae subsp. tuberculatae]MCW8165407.1 LacI family DNA-binding transcriptional regulator [Verminephrobacter aporrectodeae subsp. tuberculatae]MCW8169499.1 LacI family DNA-binding transcriptional regulator [V
MSKQTPGFRAATILDVASAANVSKSTVSLVLRGSELISAETSRRVRTAASKIGYVYNRRAAELRRQSSNTIGVVINDLRNSFFVEVLVGLERRLADAGYTVFMAHTNEDLNRQQRLLTVLREQGVAGIAICPALATPASLPRTVKSWGIPMVVMVRTLGVGSYDFAGSDNCAGVRYAMNHLIGRGHEHVAFLGGVTGPVLQQRLDGYKDALHAHRVGFDPDLIVTSPPTREGGHAAMLHLLSTHKRVKAAVCYNDLTAFGALSALGDCGLRAGTDFALVGFDNILDSAHSNPPLSTVDVKSEVIGAEAAQLLLARIKAPGTRVRRFVQAPALVLRQSA